MHLSFEEIKRPCESDIESSSIGGQKTGADDNVRSDDSHRVSKVRISRDGAIEADHLVELELNNKTKLNRFDKT